MAILTTFKNDIEGTLVMSDGTSPTPLSATATFLRGDFAVNGPLKTILNETVVIESRGIFRTVAHGARIYPAGSFSCLLAEFETDDGTPQDLVFASGTAFSAAVSTLGANARKHTLDLAWTMEGTDLGDAADHTLTLTDCEVVVDSFTEAREGNYVQFSFVCYGTVGASGGWTLAGLT